MIAKSDRKTLQTAQTLVPAMVHVRAIGIPRPSQNDGYHRSCQGIGGLLDTVMYCSATPSVLLKSMATSECPSEEVAILSMAVLGVVNRATDGTEAVLECFPWLLG